MEFKDELDALGVKVDKIDKRVAVLEDGTGGWKIRGTFRFDAKFSNDTDNGKYYYTGTDNKNQFEKDRFRLYLTKQIDANTYFFAEYRTGGNAGNSTGMGDLVGSKWTSLYVNTKLPYDIDFRVGRFTVDFEDDYGLYTDNDAVFGDFRTDGFRLKKQWGALSATAIIGRNDNSAQADYNYNWTSNKSTEDRNGEDYMSYILDLHYQPNEKLFLGATGYYFDNDKDNVTDKGVQTYNFYAGYNFTPAVALKGIYYIQKLDDNVGVGYYGLPASSAAVEDSPHAWKLILDVKQEALKFTSLWVEYSQQENSFQAINDRYSIGGNVYDYVGRNLKFADMNNTSKFWFAKADQKWNDKWSTFVRFVNVDYDTDGLDNATEWGLGVGYQYTPALYFELAYDQVDYGDNNSMAANGDIARGSDHVVRFRTTVNF